jgi:general secretion pathway protein G
MSGSRRSHRRGFTLIELMVVMVILVLLAALVLPRVVGRTDQARRTSSIAQMRILMSALGQYGIDNAAKVPSSEQGLAALITEPTGSPKPKQWRGPYLDSNEVPKDGWGNEFIYIALDNDREYRLSSLGADGVEGGDDYDADIKSWERDTWAEE